MAGLYQNARIEEKLDQLLAGGGGTASAAAAMPPGYIASFLVGALPDGWLPLDGSVRPTIAENPVLYALFGTKFNVVLDELALRAAVAKQYPNLTGNAGAMGWSAQASSEYSATYAAFYAFNGVLAAASTTDAWVASANTAAGFLQLNCAAPQFLARYEITARGQAASQSGDYPPRTFTLKGLVDGTWVVLDARTNLAAWVYGERRVFELDASQLATAATAYKLEIPANTGMVINELALFSVPSLSQFTITASAGTFGLPNLKSAPAAFAGGTWAVKAG